MSGDAIQSPGGGAIHALAEGALQAMREDATQPGSAIASATAPAMEPPAAARARIFSLSERLGRVRYLVYSVLAGLACVVALVAVYRVAAYFPPALNLLMSRIAYVCVGKVLLPVMFCVLSIRRLHDINARGWWVVLMLIPFAGMILACIPGTKGPNRYGLLPPRNGQLLNTAAVLGPLLLIGLFLASYHREGRQRGFGETPSPWQQPSPPGSSSAPLRPYQP